MPKTTNMLSPMKFVLSALLFSLLLSTCKKKEDTPTLAINNCPGCTIVPQITFLGIRVNTMTSLTQPAYKYDSITISLQYKDLDGNLGHIMDNQNYSNYFCEIEYKDVGGFKQMFDTIQSGFDTTKAIVEITRNARFTPLPVQPKGSIFSATGTANMGTLNYSMETFLYKKFEDSASYKLKFRIHVADNDGNMSDTIETSEVLIHNYYY